MKLLFGVVKAEQLLRIIFQDKDPPVPSVAFTVREIFAFERVGVKTRDVSICHEPADGILAPGNGDEMFAIGRFAGEEREVGLLINNPPRALILDRAHRVVGLLVVKHEQPVVMQAGELRRRARAGGGGETPVFAVNPGVGPIEGRLFVKSRGLAHVEADLAGDVLGVARVVRDGESHVNDLTL